MPSLTSAAVLAAVALLVPLAVRLARLRVPEVAVQIVVGAVIGPQVLGWARVDEPVRVLSVLGLASAHAGESHRSVADAADR